MQGLLIILPVPQLAIQLLQSKFTETGQHDLQFMQKIIAHLQREKQILSLICSQYANKIETSKPIEHNLKIDPQIHIPPTPEECKRIIKCNRAWSESGFL